MSSKPQDIDCPRLNLQYCTTEQHCESLLRFKELPFWWYQDLDRLGRNFSLPFKDDAGHWVVSSQAGVCLARRCN